ncbi:hypothetical protein C6502_14895 [Candidatus Poribacteria bacterium]|nr:MAG: hypothetical protein C6502_14895 [Candidatus Poribacteria bacterium]
MKRFSICFLFVLFTYPCIAFGQGAPSSTGEIYGTVYQVDPERPVASVQIRIVETNQRARTDQNGEFRFPNLSPGQYTLTASASGYQPPEDVVVTIEQGETIQLKIYLEQVAVELDEVEVTGERAASPVGRQTLSSAEIQRVPGSTGDALRALQALPSVGVANDFSGALYIRGGSDEDNLYYFDRVPIGYPYHFGGIVSSLSSEVIERIDVYAGGYGAEFGVDSQAVIDIYSRNKNTDGFRAKLNLNVLYSEGLLEGKISNQGYWYFAGRRSYIDLFLGSLAFDSGEITAFPRFWDYQLKGGYDLNDKHQLSLNIFASGDSFALKLDGEDVDQDFRGNVSFESGFEGGGIHLRSRFTDRLTSFLSLTRSDFQFDVRAGPEISLTIDAPDYLLREDLTYTLNPKHQLETGVIFGFETGRAVGTGNRPPDEGEVDYDFRLAERQTFDESVSSRRMEVYLQDRYRVLPFLSVALGLRVDYFSLVDEFSIQPRGSLLLDIMEGSQLQLSYGNYHQVPGPPRLTQSVGNPDLTTSEASHYVLEFTRQVSEGTEFKFAGYYKDLAHLVTNDEDMKYLNQGVGFAQGMEVFLRHRAGDRFLGWGSYTYGVSKRRDRPEEPYRYYSFDQTHVATLAATYRLTPTWEIGLKWQYRTGNPYTPELGVTRIIDRRNGEPIYIPIYGDINSERLPPYHRLDVKISKAFRFNSWEMSLFLELLNAYNRKNLLTYSYSDDYDEDDREVIYYDGDEREEIYQFPIIPYLGITTEF